MKKKLCSQCHDIFPLTSFHANRSQPDGLSNVCKDCRKGYQSDWRDQRRKEVRVSGTPFEILKGNLEITPGPLDTDCWIWTGRLHEGGYGIVSYRGVEVRVHLGLWIAINGPKPDGYDLDHLCRVRPCFNPDHLELTTRKENLNRGSGNKGEVNGMAKLTEKQVARIKIALEKDIPGRRIGEFFGVKDSTISNIKHEIIWSSVEPDYSWDVSIIPNEPFQQRSPSGSSHGKAKLTEEDVVVIRQRYADGEKPKKIAVDYPIDPSGISNIVARRTWKHVD